MIDSLQFKYVQQHFSRDRFIIILELHDVKIKLNISIQFCSRRNMKIMLPSDLVCSIIMHPTQTTKEDDTFISLRTPCTKLFRLIFDKY